MLKIQLCHHINKLDFKIYSNRKQILEIVIIFHNILLRTRKKLCESIIFFMSLHCLEHKKKMENIIFDKFYSYVMSSVEDTRTKFSKKN